MLRISNFSDFTELAFAMRDCGEYNVMLAMALTERDCFSKANKLRFLSYLKRLESVEAISEELDRKGYYIFDDKIIDNDSVLEDATSCIYKTRDIFQYLMDNYRIAEAKFFRRLRKPRNKDIHDYISL